MRRRRYVIASIALTFMVINAGPAAAEILVSDQVVVGVNPDGSLCDDDLLAGLLYDPDGVTGSEPLGQDMLLPGYPYETWALTYRRSGSPQSHVSGGPHLAGGADVTWDAVGDNGRMMWLDGVASLGAFDVEISFDLPGDLEVLWITITLTATADVTNVWLSRTVDADQDFPFGTYDTINEASDGVAVADAQYTGRALALTAAGAHAAVCTSWCQTPSDVTSGRQRAVAPSRG